jgi:hypothetical protein
MTTQEAAAIKAHAQQGLRVKLNRAAEKVEKAAETIAFQTGLLDDLAAKRHGGKS